MKKLSIIRFKPKPECFDEFLASMKAYAKDRATSNPPTHLLMTTKDEVIGVVIRGDDAINESMKTGVNWLDQQRHLLQEYNEVDRHTMPVTGDLVEY
jgi:hypothetical protein|tara:strand:- start:122 stop:412 length:291 start_codon:yes stop_codon:yes gene_type:complete